MCENMYSRQHYGHTNKWREHSQNKTQFKNHIFIATTFIICHGGDDGELDNEVEESLQKDPANLKKYSSARLLNAPKNLEIGDVEIQLKMFEFVDSVNQKLKRGKEGRGRQDKVIELLMLHTSPRRMPETPWAQGRPGSNTRDLWRHWWEGPSDPSVDEGPDYSKRFPPIKIKSHKGKAISYE